MANEWLTEATSVILRVPSVIIEKEYNYLINPKHRDFKLIRLIDVEDFNFDERF